MTFALVSGDGRETLSYMHFRAHIVGTLIIATVIISVAMVSSAMVVASVAQDDPGEHPLRVEINPFLGTDPGPIGGASPEPQATAPMHRAVIPGFAADGPLPPTPTPEPTATPTAVAPTQVPTTSAQHADEPAPARGDPYAACLNHPDRFNWHTYASAYDWPMAEVETVVARESSGDLCAINASSGATCWFQIHPGGSGYLDPQACVAAAYAKWRGSGGSFAQDWYRFW